MHIRPVDPDVIPAQSIILPTAQHGEQENIPPPVEANKEEKVTFTRRRAEERSGKQRRQPPSEEAEEEEDPVNAMTYTAGGQVESFGLPAGAHRLDQSV